MGHKRSILDSLNFLISFDMKNWQYAYEEKIGYITRKISLDSFLPPTDPARYHNVF